MYVMAKHHPEVNSSERDLRNLTSREFDDSSRRLDALSSAWKVIFSTCNGMGMHSDFYASYVDGENGIAVGSQQGLEKS